MVTISDLMPPNRDTIAGLGAKLREARLAAGLSQYEAADASGVHQVSITRFETEKATPTLRLLYALANAYGVDVCDLLPKPSKKTRKPKTNPDKPKP
jgi:transcriptional regulator with XRE-family HTH domain